MNLFKDKKDERIEVLIEAVHNLQKQQKFLGDCVEQLALNGAKQKALILNLAKQIGFTDDVKEEIRKLDKTDKKYKQIGKKLEG